MRRTTTAVGLLVLAPMLLGKGCGDNEDPPGPLPDGTPTGTLVTQTGSTPTGSTTDVTTTESLCKVAWAELPNGWNNGMDILVADPDMRVPVVVARSENVDAGDETAFEIWTWEYEADLVFSPRGHEVAFFARTYFPYPDGGETYEIWIAPIDGSGAKRLITPGGYYRGGPISWSPDGTTLAFQAETHAIDTTYDYFSGRNEIFTVGVDGSNLTQVSDGDLSDYRESYHPSWSPSGDALAWYDNLGTLMLKVGQGAPAAVPNAVTDDAPDNPISWSADGQTLYYFSDLTGITAIRRDGSGLTSISNSNDGRFPKLSPARDKFIYGGWTNLKVVNADTTGASFVGDYPARPARWGPGDTAWVCMDGNELVEVPVDGSPVTAHPTTYACTGPVSFSSHCFSGVR